MDGDFVFKVTWIVCKMICDKKVVNFHYFITYCQVIVIGIDLAAFSLIINYIH